MSTALHPQQWRIEVVELAKAAPEQAYASRHELGLFDFRSLSARDWPAVEDRVVGADIDWVALLPPGALDDPALCQIVSRHFVDYHTTPIDADRLSAILGHVRGMAQLRVRASQSPPTQAIGSNNPTMHRINRELRKAAASHAPVLIGGETGAGKELAARTLHTMSARANGPLVIVDCGALPQHLIQSELFGHERGAFTGADRRRTGRLEAAEGGTLFLDEIGDLPLEQQVSLLRFLQEGTVQRLGSTHPTTVDARVIAATHVDLAEAVRQGRFREDLYYRLNVITITLPPLRERRDEIDELATACFEELRAGTTCRARGFSRDAQLQMRQYRWPGNFRELRNRIQRAIVMGEGRLITASDLGLGPAPASGEACSLQQARRLAEREAIERALTAAGGNRSKAAEQLAVSRVTLYRLLTRHGLVPTDGGERPRGN